MRSLLNVVASVAPRFLSRLRFGIEPPPRGGHGSTSSGVFAGGDDDTKEREDPRRRALAKTEPAPFPGLLVTGWMSGHDARLKEKGTPRVIALVGHNAEARAHIARTSFQNPWAAS